MGFAESSESRIYVGKTLTEGVEPSTYETLTPISHDVSGTAGSFQSEDIDPSGKGLDSFRTSSASRGSIVAHWRPSIFDSIVECALRGAFGSAFSPTYTISFGAPSSGLQTLTDDATGGTLGAGLSVGDTILVGGAVANALNAGLRVVLAILSADSIQVYNPTGAASAADAGVDIDHAGVATLGTTKAWLWAERLHSDGSNLIYSEFFKDLVLESWSIQFPAAGPSRATFAMQGDPPTLTHADGSVPIVKQRGGSDNAASTQRLVHGMDDVRQVVMRSASLGITIVLHDVHNLLEFSVSRPIRQDSAVGTPDIINTAAGRPSVSGRIDAYLNSVADGTSFLAEFQRQNPDDLEMWVIAGATEATAYGFYFSTVRVQQAPSPVGGNNAATLLNAQWTATDVRVTRL